MPKIIVTENFIEMSNKIHNNYYKYDMTKYINSKTKVIITCPNHGDFLQTPNHHLQGFGCNKCGIEKNKIKLKKTKNEFIEKAKEIHLNKYDYSKIIYINDKTKIKIICPEHGIFKQRPNNHLLGQGCPKCSIEKNSSLRRKTNKQFIVESNKIHDNFYLYKNVNYLNNKTKVIITCLNHGDFEQLPENHLQGKGCPKCANILRRLKRIKEIEKDKYNGNQLIPSYNPKACEIFDKISEENNIHIQHAMNGGEYYLKELGYWVDGYDTKNNIVYEYDEKHHKYQKEKDLIREQEIIDLLGCKFIRIKE